MFSVQGGKGIATMSADLLDIVKRAHPNSQEFDELRAKIGNLIVLQQHRAVNKEIDTSGDPFKSLSEKTINQIRDGASGETVRGPYHILQDTGKMVGSVHWRNVGGDVHVSPGDDEMGRALGHQLGIGRLPKREWVGFRPGDVDEVVESALGWVEEIIRP